jgi:hypothetical protein
MKDDNGSKATGTKGCFSRSAVRPQSTVAGAGMKAGEVTVRVAARFLPAVEYLANAGRSRP